MSLDLGTTSNPANVGSAGSDIFHSDHPLDTECGTACISYNIS